MRRRAGALAAAALGLSLAAGAIAQERRDPVAAVDPARDVRGPLDVRRVALGVGPDRRLRGEITLAREWGTADLRGSGGDGSLCLRLFLDRDPEGEPPDYLVCATPAATGDELVGRVLRDRANGLPRSVAEAIVSRPTQRTVFLRFAQSAVGRPAGLRFGAESVYRGRGCPPPGACRDLAPDHPRIMYLELRGTR